jgi:TPR repeat protein
MRWISLALALFWVPVAMGQVPFNAETAVELSPDEQREQAQRFLGGDPPDLRQARLWLEAAASGGSADALAALGWFFEQGLDVEMDMQQAMTFYAAAYAAGATEYGLRLGWMLIRGAGIEVDRKQGEEWFRRVIEERQDPDAKLALASVLAADAIAGLTPDSALEAREWLVQALNAGRIEAVRELAGMHINGMGSIQPDPKQAAYYTQMGAEAGDPEMQGWLATMFANGDGVPLDAVEAHRWAALAASGGDVFGNQIRLQLERELNREQLIESRLRALHWLYSGINSGGASSRTTRR